MWLLFLISLGIASCNKSEDLPPPPPTQNPVDTMANDTSSQDTVRFNYLALGDSYTIGTGLPDTNDRYPKQLVASLTADPLFMSNQPRIIAQNGWTTQNLITAIDQAEFDTTYGLVSLLIGVNNQFQNRPIDEYAIQFEQLLNTAIQLANNDTSRVFVLSIPDYGITPFGQAYPNASAGVDEFNSINLDITEDYGVSYFNITEISRKAENDPSLLAPDNLHPSGEMYALWVELVLNEIKEKLYD